MGFFKRKKKTRVCVIGLDGVPHFMLQDLAQKGVMPFFADLIQSGHLHKMKASLPEISSVSWTNFMTGTNPGTHGIFGFTDLKPQSYDMRFPNYSDVKTETFWDKLGDEKKRSIIINQPSTYPARRLNGILISGFVAIEMSKSIYPLTYKDALENLGYEIDIDTFRAREDHDFLWQELQKTLKGRENALDMLWQEDWDYFEFVITGTDRLQHFLWTAYQDDSHPFHSNFLDYYHQVDRVVKKIVDQHRELAGSDDGLYLLSDHGFTGITQEVYLNAWLEKEGYLRFNTDEPKDLSDIHPDSIAFAMDPNRIYLHLADKYPHGKVSSGEKSAIKKELQTKLSTLDYQGTPVVKQVFDTEAMYSGPYVSAGPDLIALSLPGFDMKGSIKKKEIFGRTNLQGMHTWEDAFFWANQTLQQDLHISDLASIFLKHYE